MSKLDKYPIPQVEDLLATLAGGRVFSKINLSQAYQQLPLDEESQKLVVINTQKGLFKYTRSLLHWESFRGSWRTYCKGSRG